MSFVSSNGKDSVAKQKRTEKTLLEQMQISDIEIHRRMELLSLDYESLKLLAEQLPIIEKYIDLIVDEFYEKQTEIDEINLLIGDADTLERLRSAQRDYVIDLFSGMYDSEYVNNRLRIGMVHKRIGVEPKLYLSAVRTLKEILIRILKQNATDTQALDQVLETLDKLMYFDTTLVFDTYIDSLVGEIEAARRRTEIYAKSLEIKVAERTRQLEEQAKLDPLTSLYNRGAMQDILRRELANAKRRHTRLSLAYFDMDDFKEINDTLGHMEGDEVLKNLGQILLRTVRTTDIPCRYGGDEFCLILPECGIAYAETICRKILKEFSLQYPDCHISMGIAETGPEDFVDDNQLIRLADERMYLAKRGEGAQICT